MLKPTEQAVYSNTAVPVAATSSPTNDAAVGQLIDFDADTPSPVPATAMANLCMSVNDASPH